MIASPSQWQINMAGSHDQIVVTKKPFLMKFFDFITRFEPEYVVVKQKNLKGRIEEVVVDKRLVLILSKEEINSKVSSDIKYNKLNKDGGSFGGLRDGKITTSINDLIIFVDNTAYSFPIPIIESCIEKSKRKYNMLHDSNDDYLDYKNVKMVSITDFDYKGYHYEFKNGFALEFIFYELENKNDKTKDKFRILENFLKISASGNDAVEVEDKIYNLVTSKLNILSKESEDKVYESTLLFNSYTEIIKECVEITKIEDSKEIKEEK